MTADRLEKIRSLFDAALERKPVERAAFLAEACAGDQSLEAEVKALLEAHDEAPDFLDEPAWVKLRDSSAETGADSASLDVEPDLPFERLGEFRVIRRIGEGGMGIVYLAVQESLGRQVALKVIRPERMGSFEAEERFWREGEAVSTLRHPNIVTVIASGEEQGVRYFAMELVPGRGLDEVLHEAASRGERIATPQAIGWIREIALALDSAHGAGVVHRDVKPSNIQITPEERAMLMDFGVARHVNLSTLTLTGDFRGTPNYASPEQVKAKREQIDSRTDIYSLGVTLYEAVTGHVPFAGETTEQVFHQILEKDPRAPRSLNPAISRDLETVIITTMEKERGRRYQSMAVFAGDLQRLLNGEMILAKPAGLATRTWKQVKRHPVSSTAVGVAVTALVGFVLYVMLWSYPQIIEARNKTDEQYRKTLAAKAETDKQYKATLAAKAETEKEAEKTNVINEFLRNMFLSPDPDVDGRDVKVVDVLDKAADRIGRDFTEQPEIEAALRLTIGHTYHLLGLYKAEEPHQKKALEIYERLKGSDHPDTLAAMIALANAYMNQGRLSKAEDLYRRVRETSLASFGEEHELVLKSMQNLGLVLKEQGDIAGAEKIQRKLLEIHLRNKGEEHPDTIKVMNNLASALWRLGRLAEAEGLHKKGLAIKRRVLGDEHTSTIASMFNLAVVLKYQGKLGEAEELQREVLEIQERRLGGEHPHTLLAIYNLALTFMSQGRFPEAEVLQKKALEGQRRVLSEEHPNTINTMGCLAFNLINQERFVEAEEILRETLDLSIRVRGEEHPDTLMTMGNLVAVLQSLKNLSEAEAFSKRLIEISLGMGPRYKPKTAEYRADYAGGLIIMKRYGDAEAQLLTALEEAKASVGEGHAVTNKVMEVFVKLYDVWDRPGKAQEYRALISSSRDPAPEE